ncbi:hypothetical protein B484DRAFT_444436 [Ochromonadaceae sp. CCMP2298]|nr:hypothetical protein B484DRAFT_444436 [Ochromonadaceae sp. CCMP2298]
MLARPLRGARLAFRLVTPKSRAGTCCWLLAPVLSVGRCRSAVARARWLAATSPSLRLRADPSP